MEVLGLGMTGNKHRHSIVSMCINKIFCQIMKKKRKETVLKDMGNVYWPIKQLHQCYFYNMISKPMVAPKIGKWE